MPTSPKRSRAEQRAESARRILEAARSEFAEHGYEKTTIRRIAAHAGVDPALVMQHHGTKAALFRSAVQLDDDGADTAQDHLESVIDARIAGLPSELHALVRSMLTVPEAADAMRDHLDERAANLARSLNGPDKEGRAVVAVCAILGLTLGKHFLHLGAFDELSDTELSRIARDWIAGNAATDSDSQSR